MGVRCGVGAVRGVGVVWRVGVVWCGVVRGVGVVWCGVVWCVVWEFFRGKTFLQKKNGFPPPPLSKETFTKLYPFLLLFYLPNKLSFSAKNYIPHYKKYTFLIVAKSLK